jgi:hypothetical protein
LVVVVAAVLEVVGVLVMVIATQMIVEEAMVVAMTMAHAAHVMTTAVMEVVVAVAADTDLHDGTITAREESIVMPLTEAIAAGTADERTVEVVAVEAVTTTVLLLPLPAPVVTTAHLLHVRRTAEAARTRVTTTVLTASSPLTVPEPKRY